MADLGETWPAQGDCPEEAPNLIPKEYLETIKHVIASFDDFDTNFPATGEKMGVDV